MVGTDLQEERGRERDKSETSRGVRRDWVYFRFQLDRKLWQKVRSLTQRRERGETRTVGVAKEGDGEKKAWNAAIERGDGAGAESGGRKERA